MGSKIIEIFNKIAYNVLSALYQPFWAAVLLAFLAMFLYLYAKEHTLSDNGGVTRGICKMDDQNNLTEVVETKNIVKTTDGAEADGKIIDTESLVSMNMWGLTPEFLPVLEHGFEEFFEKEVPVAPMKAEYLIPTFICELLEQGKTSVKVLQSNDTWYGMTYKEDVAAVKESFEKMLEQGIYRRDLFADL